MNVILLIVEALLSREATWAFVAGLALALGVYLYGHFRQVKQLTYQIMANSRVGLVPVQPDQGGHGPALQKVLETLRYVSVVVVRFSNDGSKEISASEYDKSIDLRFPGRYIIDFRVTGARPQDPLRKRILSESWATGLDTDIEGTSQLLHRDEIRRDVESALSGQLTEAQKEERQQLTLPNLALKPGDEFFLLVDLHELRPGDRPDNITKDLELRGEIRSGSSSVPLVDALQRRRWFRRARFAGATALFLAGVVIVLFLNQILQPFGGISCNSGSAKLVGSTAFEPEVRTIVREYQARCRRATIDVETVGTEAGSRRLREANNADEIASVADGRLKDASDLQFVPIAIVTSAVVVNSDVGVDSLTLDQLRAVYQGRYSSWRQLGGADVPIRLVSRNADSGTRLAFEGNVLHGGEPVLTSNSCVTYDRPEKGPAIRCERTTTAEVLDTVERTPGAIGYADAVTAAKHNSVVRLRLDGKEPTPEYLDRGYPFWTVERLYTKGLPAQDSLLKQLIDYLSSDTVKARLREAGYLPCVQAQGTILPLCQTDH